MSLCVVAIHTHPLDGFSHCVGYPIFSRIFDCVVRCAVPFFFLSSGYLLGKKTLQQPELTLSVIIARHLPKNIRQYLLWSAIYFPLAAYHLWQTGCTPVQGILRYLRGLIFIGENYNSWMLWYLLSSIYASLFILILLRLNCKPAFIALCGSFVYFFGLAVTWLANYWGQLPYFLQIVKNGISLTVTNGRIFTGFLYIPLGLLLSKKTPSAVLATGLLFFGFCGSYYIDGICRDLMFVISSIGFFSLVTKVKLKNSRIYPIMRQISTTVYFVHMYIWTGYYSLVYGRPTYGLDSFLFTVIISLCLSLLAIRFSGKLLTQNKTQ